MLHGMAKKTPKVLKIAVDTITVAFIIPISPTLFFLTP